MFSYVNLEYQLREEPVNSEKDNISILVYYEYDVALNCYKKTLNRPMFSMFAMIGREFEVSSVKYYIFDPEYTLK